MTAFLTPGPPIRVTRYTGTARGHGCWPPLTAKWWGPQVVFYFSLGFFFTFYFSALLFPSLYYPRTLLARLRLLSHRRPTLRPPIASPPASCRSCRRGVARAEAACTRRGRRRCRRGPDGGGLIASPWEAAPTRRGQGRGARGHKSVRTGRRRSV